MDIKSILASLTQEEKIALVAGCDFMYTNPIPRLDIPSIRMSDGPHGLRVEHIGDTTTSNSEIATCFPTSATTASSWNPMNTLRLGEATGEECHHYGINVVLGPGVNIKRNPLGGRNFEYFSEDPLLAGKMGEAVVKGIESRGAGVSVKHFALNNSENYRLMGDSVADERAMREIYLKPFEIIVKGAHPETVMCAYNKINGEYCGENEWLLNDVLRNEWGFDGLVMTDWGATHDRLKMLRSGLDLEMPGDTAICRKWIKDGLESGELNEEVLDTAVLNVLRLVAKHRDDVRETADFEAHHFLAKDIAIDSAVLMKNDGALPLVKECELFVCGELFEKTRYQGSGSSMINPAFLSTPKSAFDAHGVSYSYRKGYSESKTEIEPALIEEALNASKGYSTVVIYAGLTDYVESEGTDRIDMRIPDNQLALINAMIDTGKEVIVILYGGSPMELPFADKVSAILNMYLPGQNGGEAMYSLIFGEVSPSGRLAESWPIVYSDVPLADAFGKGVNEIYKESVFVGYRYYLTRGKRVRYPFGYGLTYTTFSYENMAVEKTDNGFTVSFDLRNVGEYDSADVVQLYVAAPGKEVFCPLRELRGFEKVYLKRGEAKRVEIKIATDDLRYWSIRENRYLLESGEYQFQICTDAETVRLSESVTIAGDSIAQAFGNNVLSVYKKADIDSVTDELFEEMSGLKIPTPPPLKPIHMHSRFSDMRYTFVGKMIYSAVLSVARKEMRCAKRMPEGLERDNRIKGAIFLRRSIVSNSIITMSMAAGKRCPYNIAEAFVYLGNGRIFKGLKCLCTKIKAPQLPREKEK